MIRKAEARFKGGRFDLAECFFEVMPDGTSVIRANGDHRAAYSVGATTAEIVVTDNDGKEWQVLSLPIKPMAWDGEKWQ